MVRLTKAVAGAAAGLCLSLTGCASVAPVAYTGLASSASLKPDLQDQSGRIPFRYDTGTSYAGYAGILIDPVTVYRGPDNQFGDMPEQQRVALASYMRAAFAEKLRTRFAIAPVPTAGALRLKLTLTGATANTALLSPFTHIDMGGNVINAIQAMRGREGMISGSVSYAVEVFDSATDRLLLAYVTRQYPGAMNIGASFGSLSASEAGIDKGAGLLMSQLR